MKYSIPKDNFTGEEIIYLENAESSLVGFLRNTMNKYPGIGVIPKFTVLPRQDEFINFNSNAGFDISNSLHIYDLFMQYAKAKIKADIKKCSLYLELTFKKVDKASNKAYISENEEKKGISDGKKADKGNDYVPVFMPVKPWYDFSQIILPKDTKDSIEENLKIIQKKDLIFSKWGFSEIEPVLKMILNFYGPSGTGKTMCAHAIAKKLDKPLLALNYAEIESKYVGDAAKNLKKAFDTAKDLDAVMFFDEADSFLGKRIENVSHGSDQAINSLRSQMLILLEEFSGIVLFATNLVSNFDKAFESRILDHIKFELPDKKARAEIIKAKMPSKLPLERPFAEEDFLEAADLIEGFSGRDIKNAVLKMLAEKAKKDDAEISLFSVEDLKLALKNHKDHLDKKKQEEESRIKQKILNKIQSKAEEGKSGEKKENKDASNTPDSEVKSVQESAEESKL